MIPYELKIHGIRDYEPRKISLGEPEEHILITGPNGVGKSTLTFCFGAVLNSAKVDVEGLRSNNLKANEPWLARITFTFLNEGPSKIDGPKFIAFQLTIKQESKNAAYQKEFEVLKGPTIEELELKDRYTSSGGAGRTFKAYSEDLKVSYKIHPDHYYLIWYQQEVNQFASMSPLERFRKFSDMFNISEMQKEWEASLAQIKYATEEIRDLKSTQKGAKYNLSIAQKNLDEYLNIKKRLKESGQSYYHLLKKLIELYEKELSNLKEKKIKIEQEKDRKHVEQQQLEREKLTINANKERAEQQLQQVAALLMQVEGEIDHQQKDKKEKEIQQKELEQQLEEASEKRKLLRDNKKTTLEKLQITTEKLTKLEQEKIGNVRTKTMKQQEEKSAIKEESALNYKIEQLKNAVEAARKHRELYISSAAIEAKIAKVNQQNSADFESIEISKKKLKQLELAMSQTKQRKFESKRQQAGLADLKKQGFEAFTLRELIELIPTASTEKEKNFEAIKYSIFYVGKNYIPLNDLYYVSLNNLIPTELVSTISQLGLQIRADLNDAQSNYANKALWWVKQFFIHTPKIENAVVVDERGVRGPQEQPQLILSDAALEKLYVSQREQYERQRALLQQVHTRYEENKGMLQRLTVNLSTIRQAESVLVNEFNLSEQAMQLTKIQATMKQLAVEQQALDEHINSLNEKIAKEKYELKFYEEQMTIHELVGAFAEQQLKLDEVKRQKQVIISQLKEQMSKRESLEITVNQVKRDISKLKESIEQKESERRIIMSEIKSNTAEMIQLNHQRDSYLTLQEVCKKDLMELENVLPAEAKAPLVQLLKYPSIIHVKDEIESVKISFEQARRQKVDENAQGNFDSKKKDFDKKNAELTEAEQLLESNTIRAKDLEGKVETTINMFLVKINTLFQTYMDYFQFEGVIEKERIEETNGRVSFALYLKARKIGHQGVLEDVSMKARSGKVGKGVSGGEESLSSLLFALALLQNLSTTPSYIVLDEFDSALDDERKNKVFKLYADELKRKLIIVSPKGHDELYYNYYSKVFIIEHDATVPISRIRGIQNSHVEMQ